MEQQRLWQESSRAFGKRADPLREVMGREDCGLGTLQLMLAWCQELRLQFLGAAGLRNASRLGERSSDAERGATVFCKGTATLQLNAVPAWGIGVGSDCHVGWL